MTSERVKRLRAEQPKRTFEGKDYILTPREALARRSPEPGLVELAFFGRRGRPVNKWIHYLPFYDRVLAPYIGRPLRFLELGVMHGGSLEMWRDVFGPEATIFGIDIDPDCAAKVDAPNQVRIGSQADPEFLKAVVAEMGGVDVVLDDGSHVAEHQCISFETLWPMMAPGGLYMIEDMHTAYWDSWGGGLRRGGTAADLVKGLIDDVNGRYYPEPESWALWDEIGMIFAADSIAAVEKVSRPLTGHIWAGDPSKLGRS